MAVMGVWAFILCNRHRWDIKQKNKKPWKHIKKIFPEQKTKKSNVHFRWPNELTICADINGFQIPVKTSCTGHRYCKAKDYWLPVWEFKTLCLWQPCLNKLMHVENWHTDYLQHYLYVDISYKFTLARVFVSHACTTINTFINDLVFFKVIIQC